MTKNMFILIAFYLLVVQTAIVWFMRNDTRWFVLSGVNFLFIILVLILHGYFKTKWSKKEHELEKVESKTTTTAKIWDHQELKETVVTTKTVQIVDDEEEIEEELSIKEEITEEVQIEVEEEKSKPVAWGENMIERAKRIREEEEKQKELEEKMKKEIIIEEEFVEEGEDITEEKIQVNKPKNLVTFVCFIVSLIVWASIYFYGIGAFSLWFWQPVLASFVAFILFLILAGILWNWAKKIWYKILFILMIIASFCLSLYTWYISNDKWFYNTTNWIFDKLFNGIMNASEMFDNDDNSDVGTWFIGSGWVVDIVVSWNDLLDDVTNTGDFVANTWTWEVVIDINNDSDIEWIADNENVSIMDAVKYLINVNDIEIDTTTNTTFTYVSSSNEDYKYFKTAAREWMIWRTTNPDTNITCDTYIVMKWLAEWWNVWSYSDIKEAYRAEAESLDELNGCEQWELLLWANV